MTTPDNRETYRVTPNSEDVGFDRHGVGWSVRIDYSIETDARNPVLSMRLHAFMADALDEFAAIIASESGESQPDAVTDQGEEVVLPPEWGKVRGMEGP